MLINILIRTSFRPILFNRCLESIKSQSFKNIRIIVSYDDERALTYIPENIEKIKVVKTAQVFFYDSYCNELKSMVNSGYFFFLDDDEVLANESLLKLSKQLKNSYGVICQFNRNGILKPSNDLINQKRIQKGKIGMPCLVLHHQFKNTADVDGSVEAADFYWIKKIASKVRLKFVSLVLTNVDRRSKGAIEHT